MSSSGPAWRALASAFLVTSCTVASTASPPTTTEAPPTAVLPSPSSTTSPTDAPSTAPTPPAGSQGIGAAWELVHAFGNGSVSDIGRGPDGWVAGGSVRCREQGCGRFVAATWFSADGITWTGGPVALGRSSSIATVATDGKRWFAAGYGERLDGVFGQEALFWRSPNGRDWTLVGSMPLDPPAKGLGAVGELAAGPGGLILTYFDPLDPAPLTVYWSQNGETWRPIDRAKFGLPEDGSGAFWAATVVDDKFVLVGSCGDCGTVWSSTNGRDWTLDATLGETSRASAVGSDGRRVVVVDEQCAEECQLGIWVSEDGRTGWTRAPQQLPVNEAYVTFAAGLFILSASIENNDVPGQGVHIYTSPDGLSWTEFVETDFQGRECYSTALEGAEDRVVFLGSVECEGIWISRAPG